MFSHLERPDPATGGVGVAFTDRHGGVTPGSMGSLNLGRTDVDAAENVAENFERVRSALGVRSIVTLRQVHGTQVLDCDADQLTGWGPLSPLGDSVAGGRPLDIGDAQITAERGVALCTRVADCLPVLFADPGAGLIAAAHAGRVGLVDGVLPATVAALRQRGAGDLAAWIGPHICGACYEVPLDLQQTVAEVLPGSACRTDWGTPALDLGAAAEKQLVGLGCTVRRVDPCTRTDSSLHSHRRDGADAGRIAGLIWLT